MSRVPTKLYLPPSAARHQVDRELQEVASAVAGLFVERGIKRPILEAFEGDTVKRLRPSKVSMGSFSP